MRRKKSLKILLFIDIALLLIFIFYKGYLFIFEADFVSTNIKNIQRLDYIKVDEGFLLQYLGI